MYLTFKFEAGTQSVLTGLYWANSSGVNCKSYCDYLRNNGIVNLIK